MSAFPLICSFTVYGLPQPQGSKRVVPTRAGPRSIESNEARIRPWRSAIASEAAVAMVGKQLATGPVQLRVEFVFPRPKNHFGSGKNAGTLKASAPEYVAKAPDVDKLVRAIGDSLTGVVLRDDAQIAHVNAWKRYGEPACAWVEVRSLEAIEHEREAAA